MAKKYTLYKLLYEDATLAAKLTNAPLSKQAKTMSFDPKELIKGMQGGLKKEIETVAKLTDKPEIDKKDVDNAKKASDEVEKLIGSIAAVSGHSVKDEQPQPKVSKTQEIPRLDQEQIRQLSQQPKAPTTSTDIGTAKTEPALRRPSTQPVPQAEIESAMEAERLRQQREANLAAYPEAERQRQQALARAQSARTQQLPVTKPGMFQRLRQRIGLEEEIKKAVKAGLKR